MRTAEPSVVGLVVAALVLVHADQLGHLCDVFAIQVPRDQQRSALICCALAGQFTPVEYRAVQRLVSVRATQHDVIRFVLTHMQVAMDFEEAWAYIGEPGHFIWACKDDGRIVGWMGLPPIVDNLYRHSHLRRAHADSYTRPNEEPVVTNSPGLRTTIYRAAWGFLLVGVLYGGGPTS